MDNKNMNEEEQITWKTLYLSNPEYRKKHKEYMAQKLYCGCGSYVSRSSTPSHKKSNKHLLWIQEQRKLWKQILNKSSLTKEDQKLFEKQMKIFIDNIAQMNKQERNLVFY